LLPGTQLYKATSSSLDVEVLASRKRTLFINKKDIEVKVRVNGQQLIIAPYEVRLLYPKVDTDSGSSQDLPAQKDSKTK
jgi:hypothetical protein